MSVSGLVVTLEDDEARAAEAHARIERDPRLTVGERVGRRVPVVAQTESPEEDRTLWDALRAMAGIAHVDVTFVAFDEPRPSRGVASHDER